MKEWFTLKEVSEITGRSLNSVRLLVHRKKITNVKKVVENGREQWVVNRDELSNLSAAKEPVKEDLERFETTDETALDEEMEPKLESEEPVTTTYVMKRDKDPISEVYVASIPLDFYDNKLKEWSAERDRLIQNVIAWKVQYEQLASRMKALPAPPEYVSKKIADLENKLNEEQKKEDGFKKIEARLSELSHENGVGELKSKLDKEIEDKKRLEEENASINKEKKELLIQKNAALDEREKLIKEKKELLNSKEELNRKKESLEGELQSIKSEKDAIVKNSEELEKEKSRLENELSSMTQLYEKRLYEATRPWWKKLFGIA